jgi:ketosteroid isomerase-like protein
MRRSAIAFTTVLMLAASGDIQATTTPQNPNFPTVTKKWLAAVNQKNNADGIAAFYAKDAVGVFAEGMFVGSQAIGADLSNYVTNYGWANVQIPYEQDSAPQGNWAWSYGCFTATVQGQAATGYWSVTWVNLPGNTQHPWVMQQMTTTQAMTPVSPKCSKA